MIAKAKTKPSAPFPKKKIHEAVQAALPRGKSYVLRVSDSGIDKMKVVRVITPAWKRLRPFERIGKVLDAVDALLTPVEQKKILRFSVLTPEEYESAGLGRREDVMTD